MQFELPIGFLTAAAVASEIVITFAVSPVIFVGAFTVVIIALQILTFHVNF